MRINFRIKHGFALAEVLITIGVIGIVSAITLPSVITNYQKQQTVVQLRKAYNDLNNAVKLSEVDNGPMENWNFPASYNDSQTLEFLKTYYLPYFKGAKLFEVDKISYKCPVNLLMNYGILLNNGTLFLFFPNINARYIWIFADVNGLKGPNRIGRDIFVFDAYNFTDYIGGKSVYRIKFWQIPIATGTNYLTDNSSYGCNKENTDRFKNFYCGRLIEINNWTIPDDYPW
jgi:prepilin-type N-terminal cleavage/methylation domain-containing protein